MKKRFLLAIGIFIAVLVLAGILENIRDKRVPEGVSVARFAEVTINGITFPSELADTPDLQAKGLSERDELPKERGMLFVFEEPGPYEFWMKGMRFSIDIIWIRDSKVVAVTKNAIPEDPVETIYSPGEHVDLVLEVNAGLAGRYNIKRGDIVEINYQ